MDARNGTGGLELRIDPHHALRVEADGFLTGLCCDVVLPANGERRMEFRGLPSACTIRIYTVRGDLVRTLRHEGFEGFVAWDLRTRDNLEVAPGLYIFHVDAPGIGTHIGKFAIVK